MRRLAPLLAAVLASGCTVAGAARPEPTPPAARAPAAPRWDDLPAVEPPPEPRFGPPRRFREVRGLWVVRTTLKTPESIRTMVRAAADAGFNTLVVQVRGRADAFYASRWEPRGEQLVETPADFDPLALVLEEAHARGLAVHAWVNTNLVWSGEALPADPDHVVHAHPEWLAVPRALATPLFDVSPRDPGYVEALRRYASDNTASVEGVYTSPAHPAVRMRVLDVWVDLAERYPLDGIHFDYVRYPNLTFDYSRGALERFRSWVAPRLPAERLAALEAAYARDPLAFTDSLPAAWDEFRAAQITAIVESVYYAVKARRPDLLVSAAVFPDIEDARGNRFQEWPRWLEAGILDVAVPMAYTPDAAAFETWIADALGVATDPGRIWAGVGIFVNTFEGPVTQIDRARALGSGGVVLFSYDWARDEGGAIGPTPFLRAVGEQTFGR